ncbi:MAG: ATP synthase F1 subunit delta [Oscillospiraceae bacterium]
MAEKLERVYAEALFELCREENCLEDTFGELSLLNDIFNSNEDFIRLLSSPLLGEDEKSEVLSNVFNGEISKLTFNFLCVLSAKKRMSYFPGIYHEFKGMYLDETGILEVNITTASQISDNIKEKLIQKLEKVTGKKIFLNEKIDKSLLGGIKVQYGDKEIDSSVKSKLDELKKQINSTIA